MSASTKPTTLRGYSCPGLGMPPLFGAIEVSYQPPLMPTDEESVGGGLGRIRCRRRAGAARGGGWRAPRSR